MPSDTSYLAQSDSQFQASYGMSSGDQFDAMAYNGENCNVYVAVLDRKEHDAEFSSVKECASAIASSNYVGSRAYCCCKSEMQKCTKID